MEVDGGISLLSPDIFYSMFSHKFCILKLCYSYSLYVLEPPHLCTLSIRLKGSGTIFFELTVVPRLVKGRH